MVAVLFEANVDNGLLSRWPMFALLFHHDDLHHERPSRSRQWQRGKKIGSSKPDDHRRPRKLHGRQNHRAEQVASGLTDADLVGVAVTAVLSAAQQSSWTGSTCISAISCHGLASTLSAGYVYLQGLRHDR